MVAIKRIHTLNMIEKIFRTGLVTISFFTGACAQTKKTVSATNTGSRAIAFPGAEGFGKHANGGRGGRVMIVNNLDDKGTGCFREAAETKGARIIVFAT